MKILFWDNPISLLKNQPYIFLTCSTILFISVFLIFKSSPIGYYNALYAYQQIDPIISGGERYAADSINNEDVIPEDVKIFLKDLSLVSPVLILFTLIAVCFGSLKLLLMDPDGSNQSLNQRFPFPNSYQVYYVQMGLIGTIFGFVIAFTDIAFKDSTDVEQQSDVLFQALGTALWSTFIAILLAYVIIPLFVVPIFRKLIQIHNGLSAPELNTALDLLKKRTEETSDAIKNTGVMLDKVNKKMDQFEQSTSDAKTSLIEYTDTASKLRQITHLENLMGMEKVVISVDEYQKKLASRTTDLETKLARLEENISNLNQWKSSVSSKIDEARSNSVEALEIGKAVCSKLDDLRKVLL